MRKRARERRRKKEESERKREYKIYVPSIYYFINARKRKNAGKKIITFVFEVKIIITSDIEVKK